MKQVIVILKNSGFKYNGRFISESDTELILDDAKLGEIKIQKVEIAVRGDSE